MYNVRITTDEWGYGIPMTCKRQILNVINFIRGVEPRSEMDLITPVKEEIALLKKYSYKGTFLVQYDAMLDSRFTELLKGLDPGQFELGVWHEIVQPECEAAGIPWSGRFSWDWHAHCDFPMGYTKQQREVLIDELFCKFKETFGYFPRVLGSWLFDTHTIRYANEKYGLDAICNCRDQYGTDGYTLWGGYYGQAYYPSDRNVFLPAQNPEHQISVPLFRMLGSDPVHQYDFGMSLQNGAQKVQGVITLEPVNKRCGGGVPEWVDWYLRENFNGECMTFGYAQAGQENSFGWNAIGPGLTMQFEKFDRLVKEGKLEIETLGESGRWYKSIYNTTPASAIAAHSAYDNDGLTSVWYSTKNYRINITSENGSVRIRDLQLYSDDYADPFEDKICLANEVAYDALPVIDGNRFTGNGILSGAFVINGGDTGCGMVFTDCGSNTATVRYGNITFTLQENSITVASCDGKNFSLENRIGNFDCVPDVIGQDESHMILSHNGMQYTLRLTAGKFADDRHIISENGICRIMI